jgi:enoyl-CoA hydratase/carnithine racemase
MQMLLTGNLISAHEALSYGLINKVVPQRDLHSDTIELAVSISSKSNFAIRLGKKMFYKQLQCNNLKDAYSFATEQIVNNIQHDDAKRGIQEFLSRTTSKDKKS